MQCRLEIKLLLHVLMFKFIHSLTSSSKDRPIPVEHACNRLPYILEDEEIQLSYSAEHMAVGRCAVTITGSGYDHICVEFAQYYLDCDTDIILAGGQMSSLSGKTYRCDSRHSSDFCTAETALGVIFDRRQIKQTYIFGHVVLKVYGKGKKVSHGISTTTAFVIMGCIFGLILLLIVSATVLARVLSRSSCKDRECNDPRHTKEEIRFEPPPPYEDHISEETGMTTTQ